MATTRTTRTHDLRTISIMNIALGAWLFISAFMWMHSNAQFTNSWVVGLITAAAAAAALRFPQARYVNTVMGAWLVLSVWALATLNTATFWNHLIVGAAIFVVSLIPGVGARANRRTTV